ncbi:MAG: hypothetical protein WA766_17870, partial [Candidatus Acidiferrales bacterium]
LNDRRNGDVNDKWNGDVNDKRDDKVNHKRNDKVNDERNEKVNDRVAEARIAVGSCSAAARRLRRLEESLVGASARPGLGKLATADYFDALSPIDDVRATAEYRRDASLTLVQRAIDACVASPSSATGA